jgi:hypothetical protein
MGKIQYLCNVKKRHPMRRNDATILLDTSKWAVASLHRPCIIHVLAGKIHLKHIV